ncbi:ABC transporter permease [Bacillus massiliglaciei]|uniref:ABC transporter permease n=1 Tax=Bacillus massiliglaciei TaxID=1816693 RepID=UPI000AD458BD|nr:iron export ABC transporter permease subunit FetB [Bacillus massiliglaciei]
MQNEVNGIIDIEFWRLAAAYIFILLLILFIKRRGISREKEIILAAVRMTVQLVLAGYFLTILFKHPHPLLSLSVLAVMVAFSVFTIIRQMKFTLKKEMKKIIAISMMTGPVAALFYFNLIVIHFVPWYEARYFIPIAAMIIGSSMTGLSLAIKNLHESISDNRERIESLLMIGTRPEDAVEKYVNQAFDSAVMPTLNNMLGMGIIFLPGMMTGQILAGVSPAVAIEYQIAIILGGLGGVSLTVFAFIKMSFKAYFTKNMQLNLN